MKKYSSIIAISLMTTVCALWSPGRIAAWLGIPDTSTFRFVYAAGLVIQIAVVGCLIAGVLRPRFIRFARVISVNALAVWLLLRAYWKVFPAILPFLSSNAALFIERPFDVLVQASKQRGIPAEYIAIAGDSYAYGLGDWCIQEMAGDEGRCHSPFLLQEALGVDVISFGWMSRGSIGAYLSDFQESLRVFQKIYTRFPMPKEVLLYFYEGNDLQENILEAKALGGGGTIAERLAGAFNQSSRSELFQMQFPWRTSEMVVREIFTGEMKQWYRARLDETTVSKSDLTNIALVRNEERKLPNTLQGPAIEMAAKEIELGTYLFEEALRALEPEILSRATVVYIPSPASIYNFKGTVTTGKNRIKTSQQQIRSRSNEICLKIADVTSRLGLVFIDTRAGLQRAAMDELLHGPIDFEHFNEDGYRAFANAILSKR